MSSNHTGPTSIDREKRKTLHIGAGIAMSALLPTAVLASVTENNTAQHDQSISPNSRIKIHISKTHDSTRRAVRVDNQSGDTVTLDKLASNSITDDGLKYELDSIFDDGELVLNPHQLRMFFVTPTSFA